MAKVLTDDEMFAIIQRAKEEICSTDAYRYFLEDLAALIGNHFGGVPGPVAFDKGDGLGYTVSFKINESVPSDGGVFSKYDTGIIWQDEEEREIGYAS